MLGAKGEGKFGDLATFYDNQYEAAWTRLRYTIDHGEDNNPPGANEEGEAEEPVVFLGGAPSTHVRR